MRKLRPGGFTIVELIVVIVVIGILAAITIVAYNGITGRAKDSAVQAAAKGAYTKVSSYAVTHGDEYPSSLNAAGILSDTNATYNYSVDNNASPRTFCVTAIIDDTSYYVSHEFSTPQSGVCPGQDDSSVSDGSFMQTITDANCPTERTRAVDARDNHTYWVQKLDDDKCWMLTNLAYGGETSNGGVSTYGDVKTLTNGTSSSRTYTVASYYPPTGANVTTESTNPSTSTNGTGQYGYLYNWCAAMGNQQSTGACLNATSPAPSTSISICPAGWRLPVGNGGDFTVLNNAINSGSTSSDAGLIASPWLAQRSGSWNNGFSNQGNSGNVWSSSQSSTTSAYRLHFSSSTVGSATNSDKFGGFSVRCVAI